MSGSWMLTLERTSWYSCARSFSSLPWISFTPRSPVLILFIPTHTEGTMVSTKGTSYMYLNRIGSKETPWSQGALSWMSFMPCRRSCLCLCWWHTVTLRCKSGVVVNCPCAHSGCSATCPWLFHSELQIKNKSPLLQGCGFNLIKKALKLYCINLSDTFNLALQRFLNNKSFKKQLISSFNSVVF